MRGRDSIDVGERANCIVTAALLSGAAMALLLGTVLLTSPGNSAQSHSQISYQDQPAAVILR